MTILKTLPASYLPVAYATAPGGPEFTFTAYLRPGGSVAIVRKTAGQFEIFHVFPESSIWTYKVSELHTLLNLYIAHYIGGMEDWTITSLPGPNTHRFTVEVNGEVIAKSEFISKVAAERQAAFLRTIPEYATATVEERN